MPQMMPMEWLQIYLFLLMIILMLISFMYFSYFSSFNKSMNLNSFNLMSWFWKW